MAELELPPEVEEYRLIRILGSGAMGRVYLAEDRLLDRLVAIKFIAGTPSTSSRQRFFIEARAAARITHSNVVAVYRVAEFRRQPFLVAEYVRGQSLAELTRPLDSAQVIRIAGDLARGLAAAHRRGVLHRDIKPANAMMSEEGVTKLLDFGLAELISESGVTEKSRLAGTPIYMAPELWNGSDPSPRTDIFSLGILLFELYAGVHPFDRKDGNRANDRGQPLEALIDDADRTLCKIIERCIESEPLARFATAEALVEAIDAMSSPLRPEHRLVGGSPYRGLLAFEAEHRDVFFGRGAEALAIRERLRGERFVVVTGDSGTGKSSLCRAGVLPLIDDAIVVTVMFGRTPMVALGMALAPVLDQPEKDVATLLIDDIGGVSRSLRALGRRVVLFVDQLEELVTQASRSDAELAAETLHALVVSDGLRLLATARSDFLTRLAGLPGLGDDLTSSIELLRPLNDERLVEVVVGPAAAMGFSFESEQMVEALITEARVAEGGLPLLQFALSELWAARDLERHLIPAAALVEIGGVGGALARHADGLLAALTVENRVAARAMILALVSSEGTRAHRSYDELASLARRSSAEPETVLDMLVKGRLLVASDTESGVSSFTIAHDSLVHTWGQLVRWMDESRGERQLSEELEIATTLWERRGSRVDETWPAEDLAATRHRLQQLDVAVSPRIEEFLATGERRHRRRARRRRVVLGTALFGATIVSAVAILLVGRYLAREQRIRVNAGTIDLELVPYDWAGDTQTHVSLADLPLLSWRLHTSDPNDPNLPGPPIPSELVESSMIENASHRIERVSAPGGAAFLEITGRGRLGESCSPSWVRIAAFPGYRGAAAPGHIQIDVPTCQASRYEQVLIPRGEFIYGGPGEKPTNLYGEADYTLVERTIDLAAFAIDRMETSNRRFGPFARLESITGYPAPIYSADPIHRHDAEPEYPVTEIDAYEAEAFCRYMGKQLPTDLQWVKAARGGLTLGAAKNPYPRRLYPWGPIFMRDCVNLDGDADGYVWVSPVDAFSCGASPYGVLNLAGNVQEWISRVDQPDPENSQRVTRGGEVDSPEELDHTTTVFINHRDPREFAYSIGVRCVTSN